MKLLVTYATTDGQTRKIARHVADRLTDAGHSVELINARDATDIALNRFDGAILAGSIHVGGYQKALAHFVARRAVELAVLKTLFLSVSLSAAGHEAEDWKGLDRILAEFCDATNWTPDRVEQVAGAYLPSHYDVLRRYVMRRILAARSPGDALDTDHEYTDWAALDRALAEWTGAPVPVGPLPVEPAPAEV